MKKYSIIYADPPWSYRKQVGHGITKDKYSVMSEDEICKLPVEALAGDNCVLFLWGTWPNISKALSVISAWGFQYKTAGFVWVKTHPNGRLTLGLGHYTRGNTEFCLLGIKGSMTRLRTDIGQVIISEHWSRLEHSRKPQIIRKRIVELYGDLPRIELFSRQRAFGWDCWGDAFPETSNVMSFGKEADDGGKETRQDW